ncbi:TVP38/TMEM64 family protein [Pseudalkalibacillus decolorationis]|uniref:TVP38/TMEM64 family protein n=1 Tax=Pseudalkalibacillus decolorationis TaxID=163879 RepID=UPI002147D806|nr:VTT domain-containing protein [Pseudalkalibacillus decolorationis]
MDTSILRILDEYSEYALIISIILNILIAIAGILPSYFVTAANIIYFGFWDGMFVSFIGESIGVLIAFLLYRNGFKSNLRDRLDQHNFVKRVIDLKGRKAFIAIFSLRLMPIVPSGVVTFVAAIGIVSTWTFFIASTVGKIPALLLESLSVYHIIEWNLTGKLILASLSIGLLILIWNVNRKNTNRQV